MKESYEELVQYFKDHADEYKPYQPTEEEKIEHLRKRFRKHANLEEGCDITMDTLSKNHDSFNMLSATTGKFTDRLACELIYGTDWKNHFHELKENF